MKKQLLTWRHYFLFFSALVLSTGCDVGHISIDGENGGANGSPLSSDSIRVRIVGPSHIRAGECNYYKIYLLNDNGDQINLDNASIDLSSSISIFQDANCQVPIQRLENLADGSSQFYLAAQHVGGTFVRGDLVSRDYFARQDIQVVAGDPSQVVVTGPQRTAALRCTEFQVQLLDAFGNSASSTTTTTVGVIPDGTVQEDFYSDENCSVQAQSFNIAPTQTNRKIYFFAYNEGLTHYDYQSIGLSGGRASVEVLGTDTPSINLSVGSGAAGDCIVARVETRTQQGDALINLSAVEVDLVPGPGAQMLELFSDFECNNVLATPKVTITANEFLKRFYLKSPFAPQTFPLVANATAFASDSQPVTIGTNPSNSMAILGAPASLPVGDCGQAMVSLFDKDGNPAFISADTNVGLAASLPETEIFESNNCLGSSVGEIVFPKCMSTVTCVSTRVFSFRATQIGFLDLTASEPSLADTEASVNITVATGSADELRLVKLNADVTAGHCLPFELQTKDPYGNPILLASRREFALTATPNDNNTQFFSDNSCGNQITNLAIETGESSAPLWIRSTKAQVVIAQAAASAPPISAQNSFRIEAGLPHQIVLESVPASLGAFTCSVPIVARQFDEFMNPTADSLTFPINGLDSFTDQNCQSANSQGEFETGNHVSNAFHLSSPTEGVFNLTITPTTPPSAIVGDQAVITVTAAPDYKLLFGCNQNLTGSDCFNFEAGQCQEVWVGSVDNANNLFVPGSISVQISPSTADTVVFSDANCGQTLTPSSLTITQSTNPQRVYLRSERSQGFSLEASSSTDTETASIVIDAASPEKLTVSPLVGPTNITDSLCEGPFRVEVKDRFDNPSPVSAQTTLSFQQSTLNGSTGQAAFFEEGTCQVGSNKILANASSANFYIKANQPGLLVVRPSSGAIPVSSTRNLNVLQGGNVTFVSNSVIVSEVDFGSVEVGTQSNVRTVALFNSSPTESIAISSVTGVSSPFQITQNACSGTNLAPLNNCQISLRFSPTAASQYSDSALVSFQTTNQSKSASLSLKGSGFELQPALLVISPDYYDFGDRSVGSTTTQLISVSNTGEKPASSFTVPGPINNYSTQNTNCGSTIAAGASCQVQVTFTPTTSGTRSQSLIFGYHNGNTNQTSSLVVVGRGKTAANITLSRTTIDFGSGSIGQPSLGQTVQLTNSGQSSATEISISGLSAPFSVVSSSCGTTLVAGAVCSVTFRFEASSSGSVSRQVRWTYMDGGSSKQTSILTLSGSGNQPAAISLSASSINFGSISVGSASNRSVTLSNTGSSTATSIQILGASGVFSASTCSSLAAGASCSLSARFQPSAGASYSQTITVRYSNGTSTQSVSLLLTGSGNQGAILTFNYASINYHSKRVGSVTGKHVLVSNIGSSSATNTVFQFTSGITGPSAYFHGVRLTCGSTIAAGESCWISVEFRPNFYGNASDGIVARYRSGTAQRQSDRMSLYGFGY